MSAQADVIEAREEVAGIGEQIYEQNLRSLLEPAHTGRLVLIHLPSHDYFLGDSLVEGSDRLREKYPNAGRGEVYSRRVDRKSTRLNSSHQIISYAVFCLKKKNTSN